MLPETLTIKVPAIPDVLPAHTFVYHAWGNPAAPALLCAHGLTRNGRDFDFLAHALAKDFYVLCPDMPGRGQSEWLPAQYYNYATYTMDIAHLLSSLRIDKVHWLGTSMGGIIALMMANNKPGLIQSLILNDIGCLIPKEALQRILGYAGVTMKFSTRNEAEDHIRKICVPFGISDEAHWQHMFTHGLKQSEDGSWQLGYDSNIITPLKDTEINDVDLWPFWEAVKSLPLLLVRGKQSDILPETIAAQMAQAHPNLTRYDVADAGHAPALMAPQQVDVIKKWLGDLA